MATLSCDSSPLLATSFSCFMKLLVLKAEEKNQSLEERKLGFLGEEKTIWNRFIEGRKSEAEWKVIQRTAMGVKRRRAD